MDTFLHDLRHSLRMFWQSRGFTAAAVAALALGIGTNTAVFSVVNAVLLKPVPFPDPDRVVAFMAASPDGTNMAASPAKFEHWKEQTSVVEDVAAYRSGVLNLTGNAFPEQLKSGQVSANYFRLLGATAIRGPARLRRRRICREGTRWWCSAMRSGDDGSPQTRKLSAKASLSAARPTW
jgi:hypothetical protein